MTLPELSSAARPRCTDAGPFGSQAIPSLRMPCTRTGRPVSLESSAASSAASPASFRPYDPGPGTQMARTFSCGTPSSRATPVWTKCGFCEPVQTVTPSARTSATAQAGPLLACDWNGHHRDEILFTDHARAPDSADRALIDPAHGAGGTRAPDHPGVKHLRERNIGHVLVGAVDLAREVAAREGFPDDPVFRRRLRLCLDLDVHGVADLLVPLDLVVEVAAADQLGI